jgi:hypothetical protein
VDQTLVDNVMANIGKIFGLRNRRKEYKLILLFMTLVYKTSAILSVEYGSFPLNYWPDCKNLCAPIG